MERPVRVLIVDDYAPFRHFVCSKLENLPGLQLVGEAADGLEAVQKARELRPYLILLDIGLPGLNGIQVAQRIRELSPPPTILYVSENRSKEIAQEALRSGASGYVVKSDAANELLPAVESVLLGTPFVSSSLAARVSIGPAKSSLGDSSVRNGDVPLIPELKEKLKRQHEVGFYPDERSLLEDAARFIGDSLKAGNPAIVATTEAHRENLLPRLQKFDLDVSAAIEQGRYIAVDAEEALSMMMQDGALDSSLFMTAFGNLIQASAKTGDPDHSTVAIFGECVDLLFAQGNAEAAIQMEKLANQLIERFDVDIFCGYSLDESHLKMDDAVYQRICAEHTCIRRRRE